MATELTRYPGVGGLLAERSIRYTTWTAKATLLLLIVTLIPACGSGATAPSVPGAPSTPFAVEGEGVVFLSWTSAGGNYSVKRGLASGGPYTTIGANISESSFSDTGVTNGNTYYYVVTETNSVGESEPSGEAVATLVLATSIAGNPTLITLEVGDGQVTLGWSGVAQAAAFNVKRAIQAGGPYTPIVTSLTSTTYTDRGVTNGTTYYYVVSAVNSVGEGPDSGEANATPRSPQMAPSGLAAFRGDGQVFLTWVAVPGATSYNVKRADVTGGPYAVIGNIGTPSFTDSTVVNGTTYFYVVSAMFLSGEVLIHSRIRPLQEPPRLT